MLKEKEISGPLAFFFLSPSNIKETTWYSPYLWSLHFVGINAPFITDALPNGSPTPDVPLGHVLFDAFDIMQAFWSSRKSMKRMYFLGRVYIKLWRGEEWKTGLSNLLPPIFSTSGYVSSTSCHINNVPSKLVPEQSLHFLHLPSLPFPFFIIFMSKFSLFRECHFVSLLLAQENFRAEWNR